MIDDFYSFGRYPKVKHTRVKKVFWQSEIPDLKQFTETVLPYGLGKSYGDSCLNEGGALIDLSGMNKFISYDANSGRLTVEAGVTLKQCIDFLIPHGRFLATTPGTKYITVGGAVANDVHGKNHHARGTFGRNVHRFELLRSDGSKRICSRDENSGYFTATIGGLGLTGIITWVEFETIPCNGPMIAMENIKFRNLEEFFEINENSDKDYEYTVSWVDTTSTGNKLARGLYTRGNFASKEDQKPFIEDKAPITFPFDAPFINSLSVKAFNTLYYEKQIDTRVNSIVHYNPFFYPLDAITEWRKSYGKNGFLQYQFVIPKEKSMFYLTQMFNHIAKSGMSSFLSVLKTFGNIASPGMLSFPRDGVTLAIDFRMDGEKTLKVLEEADEMVVEAGGVIYPAKDARMSAENFKRFYPEWQEFSKFIDPMFSSSFWRRVTA